MTFFPEIMNLNRRIYCPNDSDFSQYYQEQGGKGFSDIRVVRGPRYQRGHGIGSFFGRIALPLLKYLGREAASTGMTLGKKVIENPSVRAAVKEGLKDLAEKGISEVKSKISSVQRGTGRRKSRRLYKKKRPSKSKTKHSHKKIKRVRRKKRSVKDIFA